MRKISPEEFSKAFTEASKETKELLSSGKLYDCSKSILENSKSTIDPSDLLLPIGYNLLNLFTVDDTLASFDELGIPNSLRVLADIKECLSKPVALNMSSEIIPDLQNEIAQTEKQLHEMEPLRTMAEDMKVATPNNEVPSYQSNQDDVLRNPASRWETEQN